MLVLILSDCRADGRHLPAGQVVDITEPAARELIALGRALYGQGTEPAARELIALGRAEHGSLSIEDVATVVSATDEELAKAAGDKPPARRGRATATTIPTTKED